MLGRTEESFKSEGERQIARLLKRHGLDYRYEYPLMVIDRGKLRVWYPDFWLPRYGMWIEYAGRNGDKAYDEMLEHKKKVYDELGLPVLFLSTDTFRGNWPREVLGRIERILQERPADFALRTGRRRPGSCGRAPC